MIHGDQYGIQSGYIIMGLMYFVVFLFVFDLENHVEKREAKADKRKRG